MSQINTASSRFSNNSELDTAWYQRPISRRAGIGVLLSAVAGVVAYNYLHEDIKWRNQDWGPTRNRIQDRMKELNLQLSDQFLSRFPEEKSFVEYLNRSQVPFSNFVAEMYGNALNSSDRYTDGAQFLEMFKRAAPLLLTGRTMTQELVEKVNSLLDYGSLAPLLGKVIQIGKLFQREEVRSLGDFEQNAIDYLALKSCVNILDVIDVSRRSNHAGLRRLAGYATPGSSLTNSEYAYVDLASGTNIEEYMPYVLELETRRPIILLDISPYICRYWTTLAKAVDASNLEARNLDIHKISSDTLPDKIGTFRFQNVGAWVPDLSQKWAQQLMDLVCVEGQIVFVQPFVYLMNRNVNHPEEARFIPFLNAVAPDPGNFHLIQKFAANINKDNASQWKISYGYVGKSGKIIEKQFGYIIMPTIDKPAETFENVVSFEKRT
jgi:hypothetical protein